MQGRWHLRQEFLVDWARQCRTLYSHRLFVSQGAIFLLFRLLTLEALDGSPTPLIIYLADELLSLRVPFLAFWLQLGALVPRPGASWLLAACFSESAWASRT